MPSFVEREAISTARLRTATTPQRRSENKAKDALPLPEVVDLFRELHRRQPFLFLNGITFADTGRDIVTWACESVNAEIRSRVGHHIAGTEILSMPELEKIFQL